VNLPQDWEELSFGVIPGAGYEPAEQYVSPSSAIDAVLKLYPTLTIWPGESIQTRVILKHDVCG
jgi:hypothetical protein